jgi:hypothetical protein
VSKEESEIKIVMGHRHPQSSETLRWNDLQAGVGRTVYVVELLGKHISFFTQHYTEISYVRNTHDVIVASLCQDGI